MDSRSAHILKALRRAGRQALKLAIQTGTPCRVMEGDKIVDIAAREVKKQLSKRRLNVY